MWLKNAATPLSNCCATWASWPGEFCLWSPLFWAAFNFLHSGPFKNIDLIFCTIQSCRDLPANSIKEQLGFCPRDIWMRSFVRSQIGPKKIPTLVRILRWWFKFPARRTTVSWVTGRLTVTEFNPKPPKLGLIYCRRCMTSSVPSGTTGLCKSRFFFAVLQQNSYFWMASFEDFEKGEKGQAYAKRCAILPNLLFTRTFFGVSTRFPLIPSFLRSDRKMLRKTRKIGDFSVAS